MAWMTNMKYMSIGQRLWLGFGTMGAILAVAVGLTYNRVSAVSEHIEAVAALRQPMADVGSRIEVNLYRSLAALRAAILVGTEQQKVERGQVWRETVGHMDRMDGLIAKASDPSDARAWENARAALLKLRKVQDEIELLAIIPEAEARTETLQDGEERRNAAIRRLRDQAMPHVEIVLDTLVGPVNKNGQRSGGILDRQRTLSVSAMGDAIGMGEDLLGFQGVLLAFGLGLGALIAILTVRSIVGPVIGITRSMKILATGDTTVNVPGRDRGDETGEMARSVVVFRENMIEAEQLRIHQAEAKKQAEEARRALMLEMADRFEQSVKGIVIATSTAATEMQSTSSQLAMTADSTSQQATVVSAAAEETCASVQTVAAATEELSSSISEITRQIHDAAEQSKQAADDARFTDGVIGKLAETAQRIGEIVALINDIASRTNLLALNATIEAARAGDAGKGFAVVANEVKSLANQTAKATDEISGQVKDIQQAVGDAVDAVGKIVKAVAGVDQITAIIAASAEEQAAATGEITRSINHAAQGTQQVSDNVGGVMRASSETGTAADVVQSSSAKLAEMASELGVAVDQFLLQVKAA